MHMYTQRQDVLGWDINSFILSLLHVYRIYNSDLEKLCISIQSASRAYVERLVYRTFEKNLARFPGPIIDSIFHDYGGVFT